MTTVGYGDLVPKSDFGKVIGIFCCLSGIVILALPVSVIGSNFSLYYSYAQARMRLPKRRSPALVTADRALVHDGLSGASDGNKYLIFLCNNHIETFFSGAGVIQKLDLWQCKNSISRLLNYQ